MRPVRDRNRPCCPSVPSVGHFGPGEHTGADPLATHGLDIDERLAQNIGGGGGLVQFTVGMNGKTDHIAVDAEDALIAALKVKTEHPEAVITYVRQQNRRGDARHPSHGLAEDRH
jgi:hypothetical protein